jgi:hypothetical protein
MFAEPGDLRSQRRAQSLRLTWIKGTKHSEWRAEGMIAKCDYQGLTIFAVVATNIHWSRRI